MSWSKGKPGAGAGRYEKRLFRIGGVSFTIQDEMKVKSVTEYDEETMKAEVQSTDDYWPKALANPPVGHIPCLELCPGGITASATISATTLDADELKCWRAGYIQNVTFMGREARYTNGEVIKESFGLNPPTPIRDSEDTEFPFELSPSRRSVPFSNNKETQIPFSDLPRQIWPISLESQNRLHSKGMLSKIDGTVEFDIWLCLARDGKFSRHDPENTNSNDGTVEKPYLVLLNYAHWVIDFKATTQDNGQSFSQADRNVRVVGQNDTNPDGTPCTTFTTTPLSVDQSTIYDSYLALSQRRGSFPDVRQSGGGNNRLHYELTIPGNEQKLRWMPGDGPGERGKELTADLGPIPDTPNFFEQS